MIKILNVISPNLRLLFGNHHRYTRVLSVNTSSFHQRGSRFLKPSWLPWATPVFEITFTCQDVCNCHQVKYSFWVEYNCRDLGNWYLPHWCHMITCNDAALAGNATQQIACEFDAQLQEFAFNKWQTKWSRCIKQLFNETIEVLYDTDLFPVLWIWVFTLAEFAHMGYSLHSQKVNNEYYDADGSLFLLERVSTSSLISCSNVSHVIHQVAFRHTKQIRSVKHTSSPDSIAWPRTKETQNTSN